MFQPREIVLTWLSLALQDEEAAFVRSAARIAREQRRKVEEEAGETRGCAGARGGGFAGPDGSGQWVRHVLRLQKPGLEGCTCVCSCCASLSASGHAMCTLLGHLSTSGGTMRAWV